MNNRIDQTFSGLRRQGKKAFIPFITAGDPDLKTTEELVFAFQQSGADIVELGVPFSDPMADGPTIQASSQRALDNGVTLEAILQTVQNIRKKSEIPIALMTYYNPVFHYGEKAFMNKAKACGVDGVIIPDLPPEEGRTFSALGMELDIATIYFLSPTTRKDRIPKIIKASTGFIYYVSLTGVTGAQNSLSSDHPVIRMAQKMTDKPICVGFGVSTSADVKTIAKVADGVIVGSAIVKRIQAEAGKPDLVKNTASFVKGLAAHV